MDKISGIITTPLDLKYKWSPLPPLEWKSVNESRISEKGMIHVTIDHTRSQVNHPILGLGYSFEPTSCQNLMLMADSERHKSLVALVDPTQGLGMNLWRLCIGTPDFYGFDEKFGGFGFWYSYVDSKPAAGQDAVNHVEALFSIDKDRQFIIPVVKEALEINPNIILFASPWSPPGWMKESGRMCGGRLLPEMRTAYALYLVKYLQAYEKEGIPIRAITVQNEPYHDWPPKKVKVKGQEPTLQGGMPTCFWRAHEERDFIRDFLGPAFKKAGLATEIWCYDHNWDDIPWRAARYPHVVLKDPNAAQYVSGVGFHHYSALGWSNPKLMVKHRKMIAKDVPFYFTEGSLSWAFKGAPKFTYGYMALRLVRYFRYGCSSYNGWVPMLDTEGNPNDGPFKAKHSMVQRDAQSNALIINSDYYWLGHFTKYIQRGAICVYIDHPAWKHVEFAAFRNPDNHIVIVAAHKGWKPRKCRINWQGKYIEVELPAQSIANIIWSL